MKRRRLLLAALSTALTGCASLKGAGRLPLDHPLLVTSPEQVARVARVGISVTNAVEFYKIAGKFQETQFTPSTDSLLSDAIQTTSSSNSAYYDAIKAAVGLAIAGPSISRSSASSIDADGKESETSSRSVERKTPEAPSPVSITLNPPAPDATGLTAGSESQLKYQIAKALSEQIVMLNTQMDNLVHRRKYRPYFISLRLTVQPWDRGYPYDTYLELRFAASDTSRPNPVVLPLLVSDALENSRQSQTSNLVRQLGASIKGSAGFVGASASLERTLAQLDNTLSLRPNSLLSVLKSSDQSVSVRLGANAIGESYEMIPRTHIVSLVLLVPNKAAKAEDGDDRGFNISTTVTYRDAASNLYPTRSPIPMNYELASKEYFEVPQKQPLKCPPPQSAPLLAATLSIPRPDALPAQNEFPVQLAILSGGKGLEGHPLDAELSFAQSSSQRFSVMAQDVRPTPFGLRIAFPDVSQFLRKGGMSKGVIRLLKPKSAGNKSTDDQDEEEDCATLYSALYMAAASKPGNAASPAKKGTSATNSAASAARSAVGGAGSEKSSVAVKENSAPASSPPK